MALDNFSALQSVPPAPMVKKLGNCLFPINPQPLRKSLRFAQTWTALFRAFSSHRQPSASLTKLFPSCFFFITKLRETNRNNMSQLFSMLIKFYTLNKLFYYFYEYYFLLQQNCKNETKTQHVTNYYLIKFNI